MRRSLPFLLTTAFVIGSGSVVLLTSLSLAQPANTQPVSATYSHGVLRISLPDHAPHFGEGMLTVEILDPEDGVVARSDRRVYAVARGYWRQELVLPKSLPLDDLVWHRLRYRFTYHGEETAAQQGRASISQILRLPDVHILGQHSYLSGGAAAVRLVVTGPDKETPVTSGAVQIQLIGVGQKQILYTGKLNGRGTTQANFRFPAGLAGSYSLRYSLDTAIGPVEYSQPIQLEDKASIFLTTEKPIYQPGQTIHARALALDRANHQAIAGRRLTFEVEDSRGNKVFRKITQTDAYGIASAEFGLADEVNLGTYQLRALMDDNAATSAVLSEIALQVERYVLPRFKVAVELAGNDANAKRGYRPGDHVTGTVRANYFFGKAVDRAEVTVRASGIDVARFEAGISKGQTDRDGAFAFDVRLPDFFAGNPLTRGAAPVVIEATVKDAAGHSESRAEPVTVSSSPLLVTAVPESGSLVPGLQNQVFVLTSYPDGTPAEADLRVQAPGVATQTAATDRAGIVIVALRAGDATTLRIDARDHQGNHTSVRIPLQSRGGSDQVLLRTERALYRAGEPIRLQIFSTMQSGSAYVDVVKDGQTIGTYDVDIVNGRAALDLTARPEMAGTLQLNAYVFGREGRPIADHKLVFVQPAEELKIQTELDQPAYRPGGEARIGFRVTNNRGEGVQAALGLEIVDQAVFALAEKQPGFAKVFFYLEQELMKSRYEIHSVTLPQVISSAEPHPQDLAARALFAATEQLAAANDVASDFAGAVPQNRYSQYAALYQARLRAEINQVGAHLPHPSGATAQPCDRATMAARLHEANLRDPWGNSLRVDAGTPGTNTFLVRSAGPDGKFETADDLLQYREDRFCMEPGAWGADRFNLRFENSGNLQNPLTEVTGVVLDSSGASIPRATIRIVERVTGRAHAITSGIDGRFGLAALPAGDFDIWVMAAGFRPTMLRFTLHEAQRAVLSVVLNVGSTAETVEVSAAPAALMTESAMISGRAARNAQLTSNEAPAAGPQQAASGTHARTWFPEALFVAPEIVTDPHGRASVTIPIADNITTWRMALLASTRQGALGSGTSSLKVFQDFFTELDLPVTLTQGDQVSLPVGIYNYSGARGQVHLRLVPDGWYSLDGDAPEKSLRVESGRVAGAQFTIEAKRIGKFKLTLMAEMDGPATRKDIVVREIEVVPNGRERNVVFNGRLDKPVGQVVTFPPNAIPDAGKIFVRLYPSPLSQVVEGMDAILRMPYGCFEQTSSATYPNVLALDYMKRTEKLTPEVHAKAEGFIANGYQRLLTFEVPGGGFSWFGRAPANKILTSYGLMEFSDMAKVHDIDRRLIQRTQEWLARQQQPDGSWKPDTNFINEGATNRYNTDRLRITAYIAWALENTGYQGPELQRARQYAVTNRNGSLDAYTLAVLANFAVDSGKDSALAHEAIQQLLDARTERNDQAWWSAEETGVYDVGASAVVETTGLAVQALLKSGEAPATVRKALNYITARKDAAGTWGTTQATIMALKALLVSTEKGSADAHGTVEITLNGKPVGTLAITADNADLFHQFVLKPTDPSGANNLALQFEGEGGPAYQIAGRYFVPWEGGLAEEPLSIDVSYDRTRLPQGDIASATATVRSHLATTANMVMVDLGIPPGFDLLSEDLDDYRDKRAGRKSGRLEKFSLTATQAILYFDSIAPRATVTVHYRLRAKYPIRTRTFESRVYEYYDPEVSSIARPVQMEIRKR